MPDTKGLRGAPGDVPPEERTRRVDLWEAGANERERLADERERLADERERLADERELLADRQEHEQDRWEVGQAVRALPTDQVDEAAEAAAAQTALRRAENAVRRAEAELERKRQAADRIRARAGRGASADERADGKRQVQQTFATEEGAWLADRRDFVAVERDRHADLRDEIADRRDDTAGRRERQADDRERDLMERQRRFDQIRPAGRRAKAARLAAGRQPPADVAARIDDERQRERAAAARHAAAQDRARAAEIWGPQAYGPMLLASFAPLAGQLLHNDDLHDALGRLLKFSVGAMTGCDYAGITLYRNGHVVDTVTSDPIAAELDDIQFSTGIGPAIEAMHGVNPVCVGDLARAPRWPVLAATAAEVGVASVLCHGLYLHRPAQWSALGTLNLYGTEPDSFSDADQEFGSILAAYVSVAVAIAEQRSEVDRREAALHRALSTRDVIGQAKGILMERQHLSAGDAFDLLRRVSQHLNRKLADVAEHLAETGEMPT